MIKSSGLAKALFDKQKQLLGYLKKASAELIPGPDPVPDLALVAGLSAVLAVLAALPPRFLPRLASFFRPGPFPEPGVPEQPLPIDRRIPAPRPAAPGREGGGCVASKA